MDDNQIIELYWARSENAITETSDKYGKYCHCIAYNILRNHEDSEECVNDTYLKVWEIIPPHRPERLATFLGKITRNLSLNRYEQYNAKKRGAGQINLALEELEECIPSSNNVERIIDDMELTDIFNHFLSKLTPETRKLFMRRYWYLNSVKEIAEAYGITESRVKVSLFRTRKKFKLFLEKEGINL